MAVSRVVFPTGDPSGRLRVEVDPDAATVVVRDRAELARFVLDHHSPVSLGWQEVHPDGARVPVTVSIVVAHCLGDWEAEQEVLALTRAAANRAALRGEAWRSAVERLRSQLGAARRSRRVCTLVLRKCWERLSDPRRADHMTKSELARRAGYVTDGRADTSRLVRQLGLGDRAEPLSAHQRTVNYETGLLLCRALGRDPVELGL